MSIFKKILIDNKSFTEALMEEGQSQAKTLILMRGLPGSGKSTKAQSFGLPVYSTDDFFMVNGEYVFDGKKLIENHNKNFQRSKRAMESGKSIVVDNCNLEYWEMKRYVKVALDEGFKIRFEVPDTKWRFNVKECTRRCTKGIPEGVMKRLKDKWQPYATIKKVLASKVPEGRK